MFWSCYRDALLVFTMAVRMRVISSACANCCVRSICTILDSCSKRSQYLVSLASFEAIDIFARKSARLWAAHASSTFAPILVPLLSNCFESTYSCRACNSRYKRTTSSAKLNVFSRIRLSFTKPPTIQNLEFKIQNYSTLVPVLPSRASIALCRWVMMACLPPASTKRRAACTFGPMLPAAKCPSSM